MTPRQNLGLWLWAGVLALVLVTIVPLAMGWRVVAVSITVFMVALGWHRAMRNERQGGERLWVSEPSLPPASYQRPVVLVCGDDMAGLFGPVPDDQLTLRVTDLGCYVRVTGAERLPAVIADLLAARPEWAAQLSVLLVVDPGSHTDSAVMTNRIRSFCYPLAKIRKRGIGLPLWVMSYLPGAPVTGAWFSWEAGSTNPRVREAGACVSLADWQRQASDASTEAARLQACVQLNSVVQWLAEWVVPALTESIPGHSPAKLPATFAIASAPPLALTVANNLWQRWVHGRIGVRVTDTTSHTADAHPPFPDPLLHLLPTRAAGPSRLKAYVLGMWLFVLAGAVALVSSAWQNTLLMRQVSDDLRLYASVQPGLNANGLARQEEAMAVLLQDAQRLDRYYRHGEPWSLGLGLYQGGAMRAPLQAAIAGHRQPAAAPAAVGSPSTVHLDSLSLFSSGSAQLKPESTKVLVRALLGIQARPGWLIVIAGHTDATGNDEQNLRLSRARAAAVHAWMLRMGDIPDSCFAVQGFGASQPLASNDTEHGRSANRRVEIRLVPEPGACPSANAISTLQPMPHSAALN